MGKLKIEHGISRIKRAKLQTYIDQAIADDIALMAEWTNNEQHYIVNELLRFALTQFADFQKFKMERGAKDSRIARHPKPELPVTPTGADQVPALPRPSPSSSAKPALGATSQDK